MVYFGDKGSQQGKSAALEHRAGSAPDFADPTQQDNQQLTKVYPQWGSITAHVTGYNTYFESLQARVQENMRSGVTFLVAYTYGKSLDDTASQYALNHRASRSSKRPTSVIV